MTTEHFDLANPVTKVDDIPDYEMYSQTIDSLNKRFGNRVLKGIKIGYIASEKDRIIDYLADKDYDLKLLSVHHNGQFDYLDDEVKDM
ncbi:TPA: histidinol-phosphatase, partial [Enterococcus faecium]|nr:histidinol-phosphatase [Enterococcus faecium]HCR3522798.1 histidinol-phosphatase [Enterococcus faecium]